MPPLHLAAARPAGARERVLLLEGNGHYTPYFPTNLLAIWAYKKKKAKVIPHPRLKLFGIGKAISFC